MSPAARGRLAATIGALACAVALTGCGGGTQTGGKGILKTSGPAGCGQIICATTPPPTRATKAPTVKPRVTTAPPTTRKTTKPTVRATQPVSTFDINLNGDKSGKSLIDPPQVAVYAGTRVTWHNRDVKPHGVKAENGAFNSGPIAPGGSYTWVAAPGTFPYQDSTRPYVNASIQVSPR